MYRYACDYFGNSYEMKQLTFFMNTVYTRQSFNQKQYMWNNYAFWYKKKNKAQNISNIPNIILFNFHTSEAKSQYLPYRINHFSFLQNIPIMTKNIYQIKSVIDQYEQKVVLDSDHRLNFCRFFKKILQNMFTFLL